MPWNVAELGWKKTGVINTAVFGIGFWIKSDCSLVWTEIKYEVCLKIREGKARLWVVFLWGWLAFSVHSMIHSLSTLAWPPADTASEASPGSSYRAPSQQNTVSQEEMNIVTAYNFSGFKPQMDSGPLWSPCDLGYGDIHFTACWMSLLATPPCRPPQNPLSQAHTNNSEDATIFTGSHWRKPWKRCLQLFSVIGNSDRIELFHCVRHLHNC